MKRYGIGLLVLFAIVGAFWYSWTGVPSTPEITVGTYSLFVADPTCTEFGVVLNDPVDCLEKVLLRYNGDSNVHIDHTFLLQSAVVDIELINHEFVVHLKTDRAKCES